MRAMSNIERRPLLVQDQREGAAALTEAERAELMNTEAGAMSTKWNGDAKLTQGKLGTFGEDVMVVDHSQSLAVVADGMSNGSDSFEVARRAAHQAEAILRRVDAAGFDSMDQIRFFVEGDLGDILVDIDSMDQFSRGGTTLLACRYFPKFDAMIMIDIGDCEAVLTTGQDTLALKQVDRAAKTPSHIGKAVSGSASFTHPAKEQIVTVVSLAEFRRAHTDETIHLLMATDGLYNNTGQSLSDQANEIVKHGVRTIVKQVGSSRDDIVLIDIDLSLPAVEQRQAVA